MHYTSRAVPNLEDTVYREPALGAADNTTLLTEELFALFRSRYPIKQWEENGYFTEADLRQINPHWLQFPPPSPSSHFFLAFLYVVIFLLGCFSNLLVISILASSRNLRTPPNLLIMNLAVSDFFMLLKTPVFVYNCFLQGPALGKLGCDIYGFLGGLTGTASIVTLAAVASDRYRVISSPLNLDRKTTKSSALLVIFAIWVYSFVFASLPVFGIGSYVPEGYLTSCSFDYLAQDMTTRIFIFTFFVAAWVIPFTSIIACYIAIVRAVSIHNRGIAACNDNCNGEQAKVRADGKRKAELHITRTVFSLIIIWLASWTPYAMVALLGITGRKDLITPLASMIPALFAKLSATINPFLYCLNHPKVKGEIFLRFQRFFASSSNSNSGSCRLQRKGVDIPSLYSMASLNASISMPQQMIEDELNLGDIQEKLEAEKNNPNYCSKPIPLISSRYENISLTRVESSALKFSPKNDDIFLSTGKKLHRVRSLPSLP